MEVPSKEEFLLQQQHIQKLEGILQGSQNFANLVYHRIYIVKYGGF